MPQKQPPASTAVSSAELGAAVSAAGGGMVMAGSACAAKGAAASASERRRAGRFIMEVIPVNVSAVIYGRNRPKVTHNVTRWREKEVICRFRHSGTAR